MTFIPTKQNSITPNNHSKILIITFENNITYHNYVFVNTSHPSLVFIALTYTSFFKQHNSNLKIVNIIDLTNNYSLHPNK